MFKAIENLFTSYSRLSPDAEPFQKLIVLVNMIIPVICLTGFLIGALLAWRRKGWGYYILMASVLVLMGQLIILG